MLITITMTLKQHPGSTIAQLRDYLKYQLPQQDPLFAIPGQSFVTQ